MKINLLKKRKKSLRNYWIRIKKFILITLSFLILNFAFDNTSNANELEKARQQIDSLMLDLFDYVKANKNSNKGNKDKSIILIKKYLNLDFMARATSGKYWKKASEEHKKQYKDFLISKIIDSVDLHLKALENISFEHTTSQKRGKKLIYVNGQIKNKRNRVVKMKWKLFAKDYSLLDLEVEKISLIQSQKSETLSLLKKHKGDFSKLFEEISKSKRK